MSGDIRQALENALARAVSDHTAQIERVCADLVEHVMAPIDSAVFVPADADERQAARDLIERAQITVGPFVATLAVDDGTGGVAEVDARLGGTRTIIDLGHRMEAR